MTEKLLNTLKDKKALLSFLIKAIMESEREIDGLQKMAYTLTREESPNHSPANMAKCLAVTMKQVAKSCNTIKQLATIALIQCQSDSFDGDVARLLMKMGAGDAALKTMWENKLKS